MREAVATGRTVPEAIDKALDQLQLNREQVEITILDLPSRGLLGILAGKDAKVLVRETFDAMSYASEWLEELTKKMGLSVRIGARNQDDTIHLDILGNDLGALIGRHGQTLDALQYLTTLVVNKGAGKFVPVILDIGDYRKNREKSLADLAIQSARKVKSAGGKIVLNPMNAADRRIIHMSLSDDPEISTYSIDEDPRRKVVIEKK